jgi:adenylate cyclase
MSGPNATTAHCKVFAVQDEITIAVVTSIKPAIANAELRRALRKPPESLSAWEACQRGFWHFGKSNATDNERAREYFKNAVSLDASFAPAYSAIALTYVLEGMSYAKRPMQEATRSAAEWARGAIEIDADDAEAQATLALTTSLTGNLQAAMEQASLALAINPNSAWGHSVKGTIMVFLKRPSAGRELLSMALRLSPRGPGSGLPLNGIAMSYYFERDYPNALKAAGDIVARYPKLSHAYRYVAVSLAQLGRVDEARDALRQAIEVSPQAFDLFVRSCPPWLAPDDHEHMLDGLRKAGWQG